MCKILREEFRCANFGLNYDGAHTFATSRWQESAKVNGWFVLYRLLMATLTFGVLIGSFLENQYLNTIGYWFIYYTDIGYFGLTIHMTLSAAVAIEHLIIQRDGKPADMTVLTKLSWVSYNVMTMSALAITIIYWVALYSPGSTPGAENVMVHAFNSVFIIVDLFIAARPYRLLHIYQAIIPFLSYVIFSVIYWAAGGVTADGDTAIYPILDWDKLDSTLPILAAMLVALFPFQVILWSLHLLRDFLYRKAFHVKMKSPVMARDNEAFESNDRTDDIPVVEQKTLF